MALISFELTMPNNNSWNGRWSGEGKKYFVIRKFDKKTSEKLLEKTVGMCASHYYNFGDGWGANVKVQKVDAKEANKRRKISSGFCGYDWMIDEIILHGKILEREERMRLKAIKEQSEILK